MLKRKHPLNLRDICIRKVRKILNDVLANWIRMLGLAGTISIQSYRQQLEEVTNESKTVNELHHYGHTFK